MLTLRPGARRTIWLFLLYGVLSGLCYSLSLDFVTLKMFHMAGMVAWLFGPPAILVHGTFLTTYFIETALMLVLVLIAVRASRASRTGAVVAWGIAVLAWLFFGFVAYTPAM
jgi:hypothetical protein